MSKPFLKIKFPKGRAVSFERYVGHMTGIGPMKVRMNKSLFVRWHYPEGSKIVATFFENPWDKLRAIKEGTVAAYDRRVSRKKWGVAWLVWIVFLAIIHFSF